MKPWRSPLKMDGTGASGRSLEVEGGGFLQGAPLGGRGGDSHKRGVGC